MLHRGTTCILTEKTLIFVPLFKSIETEKKSFTIIKILYLFYSRRTVLLRESRKKIFFSVPATRALPPPLLKLSGHIFFGNFF